MHRAFSPEYEPVGFVAPEDTDRPITFDEYCDYADWPERDGLAVEDGSIEGAGCPNTLAPESYPAKGAVTSRSASDLDSQRLAAPEIALEEAA